MNRLINSITARFLWAVFFLSQVAVAQVQFPQVEVTEPTGMFGEMNVIQSFQQIEIKSTYGVSTLRDSVTETNGGTVTNADGEYTLSTSTTTESIARLETAERGRYIPGVQSQAGLGGRLSTEDFTGDQYAEWGYADANNGFGFGIDVTCRYVFILNDGAKTKICQADWNANTMLAGDSAQENPSGLILDFTDGNIYEIDFSWYGYGEIEWKVVKEGLDGKQRPFIIHTFSPDAALSVKDPNLPVFAEVSNGTTTTDLDMYVGGRQYSVYTQILPTRRTNGEYRLNVTSIGTSFVPLVSFRRKGGGFLGVSVKIAGLDLENDASMIWQVRSGTSLTGASFGTPQLVTASETAVETDTSATAVSGGEFLGGGIISASGSGSNSVGSGTIELSTDISRQNIVTLMVRRVSGTGGTIDAAFLRWFEEW